MNDIIAGLREAPLLILRLDPELLNISCVSLKISSASAALAAMVGVPLGAAVALADFTAKRFVTTVLHTLLALPTVVVGLLCYSFLSHAGPLGFLNILFTPWAMIAGQFILAVPIIASFSLAAVQSVDKRARETALTLGASGWRAAHVVLTEGRIALLAAVMAGFGRVFAEVGVSMMLGGNIRYYTRNITTAIALETGRGDFSLGIALGIVLVTIAFGINILIQCVDKRRARA